VLHVVITAKEKILKESIILLVSIDHLNVGKELMLSTPNTINLDMK